MRAVGTGSAGIAFSHGYPDNERIPREVMLRAIAEMVAAVDVPVTADILAGMGDSIDAVVATVKEVIALGAAGVNIEDSSESAARTCSTPTTRPRRSAPSAPRSRRAACRSSSTRAPTATG